MPGQQFVTVESAFYIPEPDAPPKPKPLCDLIIYPQRKDGTPLPIRDKDRPAKLIFSLKRTRDGAEVAGASIALPPRRNAKAAVFQACLRFEEIARQEGLLP